MSGKDTNPVLEKIIAQYLEQVQAGDAPDRQPLLEQHSDLAKELKSPQTTVRPRSGTTRKTSVSWRFRSDGGTAAARCRLTNWTV